MAGPIDGMEVPNTVIGGYGVQSCGAGYDGLRRHGEYIHFIAWLQRRSNLILNRNTGCTQSPTKFDQPLWSQESFR